MGNGCNARFWEDPWIGNVPLSVKFSRLYNLQFSSGITLAKVFTDGWNCIRFRRTLVGEIALVME